ncbi:MAG TPA: SpoIIE family protein phosphatase [Methanoregulaceae archaeon]|nr:SpoIIE family protein phosphatase [Methanoregulaceae archaeon]HRY76200.1 SpoIIE family protein phosphatase [Methanoregulaceae archaeon]
MDIPIVATSLTLLEMSCVIIVAAYLISRSRYFAEVLKGHPSVKTQAVLAVAFGLVSIYGTISNIEVLGAIINVRDLGPMVAGLTCGPLVGLGAGLIGASHRMTLGGFTMVSCSFATVLAGLLGGIIWWFNNKKFVGIKIAVLFAIEMEALHMVLALLICRPLADAIRVVENATIPMMFANALGMLIFAVIIVNLINERRVQAERDTLVREIERKNTELAIAAEIQQSFLPEKIPPVPGFDIAAKSVMAKEVGGDFFDVIPFEIMRLKKGRVGILIADVSGKGIPAALFMALSRIVIRVNALWHPEPADAIKDANNIIAADSKAGMFVTAFYGIIDEESRVLTYVNAGHNPPMVVHAADKSTEELAATGIVLGAMEDVLYTQKTLRIAQGDVVVLYTDGVTEAINAAQEMFGEDRLRKIIVENAARPSSDILSAILDAIAAFSGDQPQADDITLMVIRGV